MPGCLVGVKGFEPPAPCSQSTCATRLRYTPVSRAAIVWCVRRRVIYYNSTRKMSTPFFNFFQIFLLPPGGPDLTSFAHASPTVHIGLTKTEWG